MPKLCDFETCRKQSSYGNFYNKPLRCKEHKKEYKLVDEENDEIYKKLVNYLG